LDAKELTQSRLRVNYFTSVAAALFLFIDAELALLAQRDTAGVTSPLLSLGIDG
jgi:hypothetical protein